MIEYNAIEQNHLFFIAFYGNQFSYYSNDLQLEMESKCNKKFPHGEGRGALI